MSLSNMDLYAYVTLVSMQWFFVARAVFILIHCLYYTVTGNSVREIQCIHKTLY